MLRWARYNVGLRHQTWPLAITLLLAWLFSRVYTKLILSQTSRDVVPNAVFSSYSPIYNADNFNGPLPQLFLSRAQSEMRLNMLIDK